MCASSWVVTLPLIVLECAGLPLLGETMLLLGAPAPGGRIRATRPVFANAISLELRWSLPSGQVLMAVITYEVSGYAHSPR